jgi:hypothetical protein
MLDRPESDSPSSSEHFITNSEKISVTYVNPPRSSPGKSTVGWLMERMSAQGIRRK